MKLINIDQNDWDKVEALARHLGRANELIACELDKLDAAICVRKKPTDRQYKIFNSDIGLIVLMDLEDINYEEPILEGRIYRCKLHDYRVYYKTTVKSICDNIIKCDYEAFKDYELTKPVTLDGHNHGLVKSAEWQVEWVTEYKEIT